MTVPDPSDLYAAIAAAPFDLAVANAVWFPPGRFVKEHQHRDLYHLDLYRGPGLLTLSGREQRFVEWMLLLIPPGVPHAFRDSGEGRLQCLTVKFRTSDPSVAKLPPIALRSQDRRFRGRVEDDFQTILEEHRTRGPGWRDAVRLRLASVLIDLLRQWRRDQDATAGSQLIDEACRYLSLHYSRRVAMTEVAAHCGVRADHLCRVFRGQLGQTPTQYLQRLRLGHAQTLLAAGRRVGESAELTGFASIHYFSRAFKRHTGRSPRQWLKRSRAGPWKESVHD